MFGFIFLWVFRAWCAVEMNISKLLECYLSKVGEVCTCWINILLLYLVFG